MEHPSPNFKHNINLDPNHSLHNAYSFNNYVYRNDFIHFNCIFNENFEFEYTDPSSIIPFVSSELPDVPNELAFNLSAYQSFYFVDQVDIGNSTLNNGDWLVSYCNDTVVGARMFTGNDMTDIPIMGHDGTEFTSNYCLAGQIPEIKIHQTNGNVIDMVATATTGSLEFYNFQHPIVNLNSFIDISLATFRQSVAICLSRFLTPASLVKESTSNLIPSSLKLISLSLRP